MLDPAKDTMMRDAIAHGVKHFLQEFNPASIKENPKEFAANVAQYAGIACFHVATDGIFDTDYGNI